MAFIYFQDVSFEFNNKLREAFSWKSKQWLFTFCHKNVLVSIWRNFLLFFFQSSNSKKKLTNGRGKNKTKSERIGNKHLILKKKQKKKRYEQFFYLLYYYYNPHQEKSLQAHFFVMVGHTPNIFRLILCTNILQEDSDWSTQFQFPPIKFQEISRYSQLNQWEARSRTTIHFFKIFRLWPSNL